MTGLGFSGGKMAENLEDELESLAKQALTKHAEGDLNAAKELYILVIAKGVSHPTIFNNLAQIYMDQADFSPAIELLDKAISLAPNHVSSLFNKACILFDLGELTKAKELFQIILNQSPNDQEVQEYVERCDYLLEMIAK